MKTKANIADKLRKLDAEEEKAVKSVTSKYRGMRSKLLHKYAFCGDQDGWDHEKYNDHFDFKKNKIIRSGSSFSSFKNPPKNCNDWVSKDDIVYLDVECFTRVPVSFDCGYGDCDEDAISHVIKHYSVCKKCGNMRLLEIEELTDTHGYRERSRAWCRMDSAETFGKIIKDFKKKMNEKFGKAMFDEKDETMAEFFDTIVDIKFRKKPYVPKKK